MTIYPKGFQIQNLFLEAIKGDDNFSYSTDNEKSILRFAYKSQKYAIFFKCISYGGTPYPINTTRAQLPNRPEFDNIQDDEIFLFLGYDTSNDVFVCWDPIKVRSRLNKKTYVSFFCRQSTQDSVTEGHIVNSELSNGDTYALFKRSDITLFLNNLEIYFPELAKYHTTKDYYAEIEGSQILVSNNIDTVSESENNNMETDNANAMEVSSDQISGLLTNIEHDSSVRELIDRLIEHGEGKVSIIQTCSNTYSEIYYKTQYKEWSELYDKYLITKITQAKALAQKRKLILNKLYSSENEIDIIKKEEVTSTESSQIVKDNDTHLEVAEKQEEYDSEQSTEETVPSGSFSVHFPDGTIIQESSANKTMIETLRKIGFNKAYEFKSVNFKGFYLVDKRKRTDGSVKWQQNIMGWFVYVIMSNEKKIATLRALSDELELNLEVVCTQNSQQSHKSHHPQR